MANIDNIRVTQAPDPWWNLVLKAWSQQITYAFRNNNPDRVSQNASLKHHTFGLGRDLHIFGRNIEGLEARVDIPAVYKVVIALNRNNYQVKTVKIEHFLKDNSQLKLQVQASL